MVLNLRSEFEVNSRVERVEQIVVEDDSFSDTSLFHVENEVRYAVLGDGPQSSTQSLSAEKAWN